MARALIQHWAYLGYPGPWKQGMEYLLTDQGSEWKPTAYVFLGDNDAQAQIRLSVSTAIRDQAVNEFGVTVETNQIIWPDGTRS